MAYSNNNLQVTSPYRFVPLNETIVSPHWERAVSHDIPFEDGYSGTIEIKMTAHSDIFVSEGKKEGQDVMEFFNVNGRYCIPSASMKGMIRNVLEIMSFGGMKGKVENDKYAFRDLRNQKEYLKYFKPDKIYCGYLRKDNNGGYELIDCGIPGRVSQVDIDAHFGTDMAAHFDRGGKYKANKDSFKSAYYKNQKFSHVVGIKKRFNKSEDKAGRLISEIQSGGQVEGKIIFTGQPSYNNLNSNKSNGKHFEFVFFRNGNENILPVEKVVIKNFKFAYFDFDPSRESIDWKEAKKNLNRGKEIPVFFQKAGGNVQHIGLSYLYKLPFKYSIHDVLIHSQKVDAVDLAETIFGNIKNKKLPLKGRVSFSNGWLSNQAQELKPRGEVLSSPKASFYPFYLKQVDGGSISYMNPNAKLSGWKRYPVHKTIKKNPSPNSNDKVLVRFKPLAAGAQFSFKMRYHNLRTIELGALLSGFTFHDKQGLFHSIGMAKPLGYGKVKIDIKTGFDIQPFLQAFEDYMNVSLGNDIPDWHQSKQIQELFAMCTEDEKQDKNLKYMDLDGFVDVKKQREYLDNYAHTQFFPKPLSTVESIRKHNNWLQNDVIKMNKLGDTASVIHHFLEHQKQNFVEKFEVFKRELVKELEQRKTRQKEKENEERHTAFERDRTDRLEAVKEGTLENFFKKHKVKMKFKEIRTAVERYGRENNDCSNEELVIRFPNGFISSEEDIRFVSEILINIGSKKRELKEMQSKRKKIIQWIGEEEATQLINQLNQK
ncbi:MAG: TIGR03986 family CRISPR-associated RAMP protein [Bacteroidetes bacterium]|nr:TIGR03986 family CRISPR-associated RAMP protein [Bacteroidota bacterium]